MAPKGSRFPFPARQFSRDMLLFQGGYLYIKTYFLDGANFQEIFFGIFATEWKVTDPF